MLVATDDAISPLIPAGAVDALLRKLFEEDVQLLCLSSREGKCVHTRAVAGEIGRFSSTDARLRGVANSQCLSPDKLCGPGKPSGIATHFIQPAASEELEVITLVAHGFTVLSIVNGHTHQSPVSWGHWAWAWR